MRALVVAVVCVGLVAGLARTRRRGPTDAERSAYLRWLAKNDPPAFFRYLTRDVARAYS